MTHLRPERVRHWRPPLLDAETAALTNVLAAPRELAALSGLAVRTRQAGDVPDPVTLGLTLGGAPSLAALPRPLLRLLLDPLDPAAADAPGAWLGLLLEVALDESLEALGRLAPFLVVRALEAPPAPAADWVALELLVGTHPVRVTLSPDAARLAASVLERVAPTRARLPGLAVPLALRVMATALPLAALRGLAAGDVILADALPDGAVLAVAGERLAWQAVRDGRQVRVTSMARRAASAGWKDWLMVDEDDGADATLGELPVRLGFELGRLELTLAELEAVGPGHVFDLARAEADAVDIVANGRRIGRGRIVEVAGALGVQVVRIDR